MEFGTEPAGFRQAAKGDLAGSMDERDEINPEDRLQLDQLGLGFRPGIMSYKQASESDFAGSINGYHQDVRNRKLQLDAIAQEHEYYRLLDQDVSEDEDVCACKANTPCPAHKKLIKISKEDKLLAESDLDVFRINICRNIGRSDEQSYFKDPKPNFSRTGMGFLSQIAQLCYESAVSSCRNQECSSYYDAMQTSAPTCDWNPFRNWAIRAMSCQAAMEDNMIFSANSVTNGKGHTHLARTVAGLCMILREYLEKDPIKPEDAYLDVDQPIEDNKIKQNQVFELIYWMGKIQYEKNIGPDRFGSWGTQLIPTEISMPVLANSLKQLEPLEICKNRFWNFVGVSDRREADASLIIEALQAPNGSGNRSIFAHRSYFDARFQEEDEVQTQSFSHKDCNPSKCQQSSISSTSKEQIHKGHPSKQPCERMKLPVVTDLPIDSANSLLVNAVQKGDCTAWNLEGTGLIGDNEPYLAISHVWADGTGRGKYAHGEVNECLFKFWKEIAENVGCQGIWWDVISVPDGSKDKATYGKALQKMHLNYENAKATLVHDQYLRGISGKNPESACIAVVLSTWFSRGWTALEFARSKNVKILFKDGLRDLDHILARSPAHASRAHWLATSWIKKLCEPVNDIGDIISILSFRTTETLSDRALIAGLLADIPDLDVTRSEASITKHILRYLGRVPQKCVLHGEATMQDVGAFSWCAGRLDDMGIPAPVSMESLEASDHLSMVNISPDGAIEGLWHCRIIKDLKEKYTIRPYGNDLSSHTKIAIALHDWKKCLILRPLSGNKEDNVLLVQPIDDNLDSNALDCHYIGAILEEYHNPDLSSDDWHLMNIKLGHSEDVSKIGFANDIMDKLLCKENSKIYKQIYPAADASGKEKKKDKETASPQQKLWMSWGAEYSQTKPAEVTLSTDPQIPSLEQLQRAIAWGKYGAIHHIVRLLDMHNLSLDDILSLAGIDKALQNLGDDEAIQAKQMLWSLGDALVERKKPEEALLVYQKILDYPVHGFVNSAIRYNIGIVQVMLNSHTVARTHFYCALNDYREHKASGCSAVKRAPFGPSNKTMKTLWRITNKNEWPSLIQESAHRFGTTSRNWNRSTLSSYYNKKKERARDYVHDLKNKKVTEWLDSERKSEVEDYETAVDWEMAEKGWYFVSRNATAALILLSASRDSTDKSECIELFDKTYDRITGKKDVRVDNSELFEDGFKKDRQFDSHSMIEELKRHQMALKKFEVIFHRNHPLVFIMAIRLGKWLMSRATWYEAKGEEVQDNDTEKEYNYLARDDWRNAKVYLDQAWNGLSQFGFIDDWEARTGKQNWWITDMTNNQNVIVEKLQRAF